MLSCCPVSGGLAWARFRGKIYNTTVVTAYAPTLAADEDSKNEFFTVLQKTIDKIPKQDMVAMAGDFNARVEKDVSTDRTAWWKASVSESAATTVNVLCSSQRRTDCGSPIRASSTNESTW